MTSTTSSLSSSTSSSSQRPLLSSSGRELLLDLKRSIQSGDVGGSPNTSQHPPTKIPILPTYNSKLVQACLQDLYNSVQELELAIKSLDRSNYHDDDDDDNPHDDHPKKSNFSMSSRPVILWHSESIERYKRCLLAFHYQRMEIMKQIQRLNNSNNSTTMTITSPIACTSANESTAAFTENGGGAGVMVIDSANQHEVDFARAYAQLRQDYSTKVFALDLPPPISHMVQVRVMQDIGHVVLPESGRSVYMSKGACFFLDRVDVQDFLQEGMVQLYDGEEMDF
jgi:hypothetical protein